MAFDKKYQIGTDESIKAFSKSITDQLSAYTAKGIEPVMDEFLDGVKASMEEYVPEDTRATKKSWFQEVEKEPGKITCVFGHDKEGLYEYIPFIYLGLDTEENPINFRNGRIPFWLEPSVKDNLPDLKSKLSKTRGKQ